MLTKEKESAILYLEFLIALSFMSANNIKEMLKQGGINMKLVPLGDRVVLKQIVAEETTKSGIVLPGQSKEKPQQAEVVAVGPGGTVDGKK